MRFKLLAVCALAGGLASVAAQALQSPESAPVVDEEPGLEYDVDLDLAPLDRLPSSCFVGTGSREGAFVAPREERQRWTLKMGKETTLKLPGNGRSFILGDAGEVVLPAKLKEEDGRYTAHTLKMRPGAGAARLARFQSSVVTFEEREGEVTGSLELTAFRGCATEACPVPVILCTTQLPFVAHARDSFLAIRR